MKDETSKSDTGAIGEYTSPKSIVLSKIESYYYWHVLVKKAFVIVTNGSPQKQPTEAYFFPDPDEDEFFPTILPFKPFPRPNRYGEIASSPCMHALKITVHDNDLQAPSLPPHQCISIKVVIMPAGGIDNWQDGIVFGSLTDTWHFPRFWQTPLWEKCGLSIPATHEMRRGVKIATEREQAISPDMKSKIGTGSLWLFLSMMDRYWRSKPESDDVRAIITRNSGIKGNHSGASILQQSAIAGLRRSNASQMMKAAKGIKKAAERFLKKHPEASLDADTNDIKIVSFRIPDELDSLIGYGNSYSMADHAIQRRIHEDITATLKDAVERSPNPQRRCVASEMLKDHVRIRGKVARESQSDRGNPKSK